MMPIDPSQGPNTSAGVVSDTRFIASTTPESRHCHSLLTTRLCGAILASISGAMLDCAGYTASVLKNVLRR